MKLPNSYPIAGVPLELQPGGSGSNAFDTPEALEINRARMLHLDSLDLPLDGKSVLDAGSGAGHLARFFLERRCQVTCIDGRTENIEALKSRLPGVPAHVARVDADPLTRYGKFDIVFCYGLLNYLEDPVAGLRNLASACDEFLLLETEVSDHELPVVRLLDEPIKASGHTVGSLGCRPTPAFVAMALTRAGFDFVYAPVTPPSHPDFQFEWLNNLDYFRANRPMRCVFVASRRELESPQLQLMLAAPANQKQSRYFLPPAGSPASRIWIDVGAHLGEKSFAAAEKDPTLRVYAFEPNLRLGAQRMGQLSNFIMLPLAVSERDGSAEFYVNTFDAASSLLPFVPEGLDQWAGKEQLRIDRTITVPTIRLDTFLDQAGIQRVEFLKIDAQGADLVVVKSCGNRLRDIDRIELEVQITPVPLYRNAATRREVVEYMEGAGFELDACEVQSRGQEENLVFVQSVAQDPSAVLAEARDLAFLRPLKPSPGWHFGIDWNNPDPLFRRRQRIWSYCQRRSLELPLEFDWYSKLKLTLYLGNDTSLALFIGGALDPNEFAFLERFLCPGMVIVDAGANEGLYTLFAAQRAGASGKVLAFEPSSRERERLSLNIKRNSLRNVTVYPAALGEAQGSATLLIAAGGHSGQNTFGGFVHSGVNLLRDEQVTVRTLDSVLAEGKVDRLDFLKMDIEGSETRLIRGAAETIRQYRPLLLLEVSDEALRKQSSSSEELLGLIQSFGYLLYVFDSGTGLPKPAQAGESAANMIAAPAERPLPGDWCAPAGSPVERQPRALQALPGKQALFDLRERQAANNSQVSGSGPVSVLTRPEQWSYAVVFPIREKARRLIAPLTEIVIRAEVLVEVGKIGIGIVGSDLSTYLIPEVQFDASRKAVNCEFVISYLPPGSALVVRNTAADRMVSKVVVRSLTTLTVRPS